MDEKSLNILEFPKILDQLAGYCAFAASVEKARALMPVTDIYLARQRQADTSEAVRLLDHPDLTIGGARDVRAPVDLARHSGVLAPNELLDVKSTLVAARTLQRTFARIGGAYPNLSGLVGQLPATLGLIDAISRAISDHGEILDSASDKLSTIRHDLRVVHERLLAKLQKMVVDPRNTPYLQENLVTIRDGRYVLPLRSEFKGRIKSIVHDQSSSGATLFVEPLTVVEQNNQYRELQLAERDEERRILTELSHQVGEQAEEILSTVEVIAELDLALARAKYSLALKGTEPDLHEMPKGQVLSTIRLYSARHPLLDPDTVVPVDVELGTGVGDHFALVITGPNTGGKTVTLKTVGLLALMAQSGLHIPATSGSEISLFKNIFADIGDEQSIEQSLSTFSGHVTNIIHILERADAHCLVILDELGAGTDPQEGAALARAILTHLVQRGITTLVTTHHPELKAYAHANKGVVNASVEFDLESLRPTFRLTIGLPGRSNALAIAQRLGMPEPIIQAARSELHPDELRAEDLLDEIHRQRDLSRQARQAAEKMRQEAADLQRELAERLEKVEEERRQTLEGARTQAAEEVQSIQAEVAEARRRLARLRQPVEALREVEEQVEALVEQVETPVERQDVAEELPGLLQPQRAIRLGDRVQVRRLGQAGVVIALTEEEAEVQLGMLRVRSRLDDLEFPVSTAAADQTKPSRKKRERSEIPAGDGAASAGLKLPESPGLELDLRGRTADEALDALESYLDSAFVAGLPFVRIIHGKGTGKLREVVRQALHGHPQVRSYGKGEDQEGGDGVTVAKLQNLK